MNLDEAERIAGKLSYPSKMPCPSWGLSPLRCKTGSILRKQKGTVCSRCYACKGRYQFPAPFFKQEKHYDGLYHPQWVEAMVTLIEATSTRYFRWFDSGDLQSRLHLVKIICIATRLPKVEFWLPTQEIRLIRRLSLPIPKNLTIRYTLPMINTKQVPNRWPYQAEVVEPDAFINGDVERTSNDKYLRCPTTWGPHKSCAEAGCRACWNKQVKLIIYRRH